MEKKNESTGRIEPIVSQIPVEGILGVIVAASEGSIAPRWLCMSEEAKEKYVQKGKDFIEKFTAQEMEAKKRRDEFNPRAFFMNG